jgi:EAL domain-containing protein (putative c-di-GMP-specific phosphodiesterase class I)
MDDFGTGYSSLSYLRSFRFDKIKIDRSFVRDLAKNSDSLAIVRAISDLGTSFGMTIIAEGVETADQLKHIELEGCTEVQGFLFSPPRPASEIPFIIARIEQSNEVLFPLRTPQVQIARVRGAMR